MAELNINLDYEGMIGSYKIKRLYNNVIKRAFDIVIAMVLLVLLSPVLTIIAILVKTTSSGTVFYRGVRAGRSFRPFKIFKFRSMVSNAENVGGGTTALNDSRITKIGSFLRKTKMDEIPQLFNIILGDMSFIGPRPELLKYAEQYEGIEKIILDVRPGITDLSSIEFINLDEIVGSEDADMAYEKYVLKKKNMLRVEYVLNQSAWLDIKLFFLTVAEVFKKALVVVCGKKEINGIHNA